MTDSKFYSLSVGFGQLLWKYVKSAPVKQNKKFILINDNETYR